MNNTKIGFIGLGKMGLPMSRQLLKAGYPVTVYNRSKDKEEALKTLGVTTAPTPGALIGQSAIIIIMVTDDKAIREIFTGKDGLLGKRTSGKIIINMSTVSPDVSREMAALCQQEGNDYLDAPVSGSVKQAEEGQLVIMVGGYESVFLEAKPVLDHIGRLTMRVGDTGAGNMAKLAINTMLGIYAQGLAETIVFAQKNGIKPEDLVNLINNSALGSPFIKIKGEAILKDNYQPAFALKHIAKDLRLASDKGLETPLARVAFQTFQDAEPVLGEEDIIAIIKQVNHK